jgi:hypothetical protein
MFFEPGCFHESGNPEAVWAPAFTFFRLFIKRRELAGGRPGRHPTELYVN